MVEQRALELFGSLKNIQDAKEQKVRLREINSERRFEKKIKQMRKEVLFFVLLNIFFLLRFLAHHK